MTLYYMYIREHGLGFPLIIFIVKVHFVLDLMEEFFKKPFYKTEQSIKSYAIITLHPQPQSKMKMHLFLSEN